MKTQRLAWLVLSFLVVVCFADDVLGKDWPKGAVVFTARSAPSEQKSAVSAKKAPRHQNLKAAEVMSRRSSATPKAREAKPAQIAEFSVKVKEATPETKRVLAEIIKRTDEGGTLVLRTNQATVASSETPAKPLNTATNAPAEAVTDSSANPESATNAPARVMEHHFTDASMAADMNAASTVKSAPAKVETAESTEEAVAKAVEKAKEKLRQSALALEARVNAARGKISRNSTTVPRDRTPPAFRLKHLEFYWIICAIFISAVALLLIRYYPNDPAAAAVKQNGRGEKSQMLARGNKATAGRREIQVSAGAPDQAEAIIITGKAQTGAAIFSHDVYVPARVTSVIKDLWRSEKEFFAKIEARFLGVRAELKDDKIYFYSVTTEGGKSVVWNSLLNFPASSSPASGLVKMRIISKPGELVMRFDFPTVEPERIPGAVPADAEQGISA